MACIIAYGLSSHNLLKTILSFICVLFPSYLKCDTLYLLPDQYIFRSVYDRIISWYPVATILVVAKIIVATGLFYFNIANIALSGLRHALPKKHVFFFLPRFREIKNKFQEEPSSFRGIKNIFPAMFFCGLFFSSPSITFF